MMDKGLGEGGWGREESQKLGMFHGHNVFMALHDRSTKYKPNMLKSKKIVTSVSLFSIRIKYFEH